MTGFLASVATIEEMEIARAGGADIVDLKDPSRGALGAWEVPAIQDAMMRYWSWPDRKPRLSATIGDHPMEPARVAHAVAVMASKGVPMVKLGLFPGGDPAGTIDAVRPLMVETDLIAVFFADKQPDFDLLPEIAGAGFTGVMVDTADKASGGVRRVMGDEAISAFVKRAAALGLMTGVAGSLRLTDVGALAPLGADYLGFRGALCLGARTGRLDPAAVARMRTALGPGSSY